MSLCYIMMMLGECILICIVKWYVTWLTHPCMFVVVVSTYDDCITWVIRE